MFFVSLAECSLGFTYVCGAAVGVTRDAIDGSTLVFFGCSVFRVYYHRAEGVPACGTSYVTDKSRRNLRQHT